jgi:uncharacterized protein
MLLPPRSPAPPASPCNKVCRINAASNLCEGCARTLDEIATWGSMSAAARLGVMEQLPMRRAVPGPTEPSA